MKAETTRRLLLLAGALEMDTAALPGGGEHPGRRRLDTFMRIADHELHAAEAAAHEAAQELGPERLGLGRADGHARDVAATIGVHPDGDGDRDTDDAPALTILQVSRVDPGTHHRGAIGSSPMARAISPLSAE